MTPTATARHAQGADPESGAGTGRSGGELDESLEKIADPKLRQTYEVALEAAREAYREVFLIDQHERVKKLVEVARQQMNERVHG